MSDAPEQDDQQSDERQHSNLLAMIRIADIDLDGGTQSRVAIDQETVEDYAEIIKRGGTLEPINLIYDGTTYWPSDGHHRVRAYRQAEEERIPAIVERGTKDDAVWAATGANVRHGLRRTNADKVNSVRMALLHPRRVEEKLSDRQIAEHVGVDQKTVSKYRREMESTEEIPQLPEHSGKDGKVRRVPNRAEAPDDSAPESEAPRKEDVRADGGDKFDPHGIPWPESALADMTDVATLRAMIRDMKNITKGLNKLKKDGRPVAKLFNSEAFRLNATYVIQAIEDMEPYCVCPECRGKRCEFCYHRGWITEKQNERFVRPTE